jgi:hypothetical protein
MVNYWHKRAYAELSTDPNDLGKRGLVYLMSEFFTISGSGSVSFVLETNGATVQFESYDISTDTYEIRASLLEAPTYTKFGATIVPRNLNRNFLDASTVELRSASAISGGVKIASELVGSTSKSGAHGDNSRVHVLKPETGYVMTFVNQGNQATGAHMNLAWSEAEPASYDLVRYGINSGGVT